MTRTLPGQFPTLKRDRLGLVDRAFTQPDLLLESSHWRAVQHPSLRAQRQMSPLLAGMPASKLRTACDYLEGSGNQCFFTLFAEFHGGRPYGWSQSTMRSQIAAPPHDRCEPTAEVSKMRCERTRHESLLRRREVAAASQSEMRPFRKCAANPNPGMIGFLSATDPAPVSPDT